MAFASMWTYPWDLHDEGTNEVLAALEGELGMDAVSLAVSYHSFIELRPHLPGPKFLAYTPSSEALRQSVETAIAESGLGPERMVVGLGAYYPATTSAEVLESNVREALDLGVWGYSFYNYGRMPYGMMPWVKRAVEIIHSQD